MNKFEETYQKIISENTRYTVQTIKLGKDGTSIHEILRTAKITPIELHKKLSENEVITELKQTPDGLNDEEREDAYREIRIISGGKLGGEVWSGFFYLSDINEVRNLIYEVLI